MLFWKASSVASVVSPAMTPPSEKPPVPFESPAPPSPSPKPPSCLRGEYPLGSAARSTLTESAPALAFPVLRAQWFTPLCLNNVVTIGNVTEGLGFCPVEVHVTLDGTPEPHLAVLPAYTPVSKS